MTLKIVFFVLLSFSFAFCAKDKLVIKVCNVTKGTKLFPPKSLEDSSKVIEEKYSGSAGHSEGHPDYDEGPGKRQPLGNGTLQFETGETNFNLIDAQFKLKNALLATALTAYSNHLPLELSPDDIWATIAYGVAQHLGGSKDEGELHRKTFVDHERKKELKIRGEAYGLKFNNSKVNKQAWPKVIAALGDLIKNNTKTDIADIVTKSFTTTGQVERTVFNCMLMDAMKNYFTYTVMLGCGIPDIILHGTKDDWRSIVDRLDKLHNMFPDFAWYLNRVKARVQKFVDSFQNGNHDVDWWNTMILKVPFGSGGQTQLSGWLAEFFPYKYAPTGERTKVQGIN